MEALNEYIDDIGEFTCEDYDAHGHFMEYAFVPGEAVYDAVEEQVECYVESSDSYFDSYLRRYDDGSTRIFIGINEDFSSTGLFEERELELDDEVMYALDTLRFY